MGQQSGLSVFEMKCSAGAVYRLVTRYVDILFVPFVLEVEVLTCYFVARTISLGIPLSLSFLGGKVAPQLQHLYRASTQHAFQAAAARVNLGYLMVCGAISVLALASESIIDGMMGGLNPLFNNMLLWLVAGQAAPVLFGATALLMRTLDRAAFYDVLHGVTTALFLAGIAVLGTSNGVLVAQALAAAQLTQAAICAVLLTQCGVWPGLTAVFHKQIKLFQS